MTTSSLKEIEIPNFNACWALLERIAASSQLRRAPRLREFLFYVGKRALKDGCDEVHEQEIGVQVFGRPGNYDTNTDNIVRVNASELRKRIEAYFDSEGLDEPLILEIPRGSYIPVFRYRPSEPKTATEVSLPKLEFTAQQAEAAAQSVSTPVQRNWARLALISSSVLCLALAICSVTLWNLFRSRDHVLYPWKYSPSLSSLWAEFLDANRDTDVIMADTSFSMIQGLRKQSYSFNEYLNRSYISQPTAQEQSSELDAVVNLIGSKYLASADTFRLAYRILALDPAGQRMHLYHAREYTPALIKQHNVILIGGRIANPWVDLFDSQLNFTVTYDQNGYPSVTNRSPIGMESKVYSIAGPIGYSVAAYLPNPDHNGKVLIIEGTTSESTEAAGDFLLSEDQLSNFKRMLHVDSLPYFNVLLKTSLVRGTPISANIIAYRAYPNLQ